jgi:hypothetical protein
MGNYTLRFILLRTLAEPELMDVNLSKFGGELRLFFDDSWSVKSGRLGYSELPSLPSSMSCQLMHCYLLQRCSRNYAPLFEQMKGEEELLSIEKG